jgi:hypothetical protein
MHVLPVIVIRNLNVSSVGFEDNTTSWASLNVVVDLFALLFHILEVPHLILGLQVSPTEGFVVVHIPVG